MVTRSFKLASISFLTFSLLLGAHQYRLHAHEQHTVQTENLQHLNTGSATMYQTNPFGMPGADAHSLTATSLNGYAAAYGISPPTAGQTSTLHAQSVTETENTEKPWYSYFGLLGLLGLLGLGSRSASS
ncbi:hypothetical protein A8709_09620 [Paenibacillus pectinilyticus]|uniref:Uncharacterized protein n=1 Tax=Paenibacillus pectinilyticus TaxID=512399 RepID=A0A1C1A5N7_9BACL|nr:hypothetical protein [Paenibacillus pectinilyticus]OCT15874.1 hypothetical protein A8709_09620 [Paenibacillus pectinilyticus]